MWKSWEEEAKERVHCGGWEIWATARDFNNQSQG